MNLKKTILSFAVVFSLLVSVFSFNISATGSIGLSGGGSYNVGQKVSVRINYSSSEQLYAGQFTVTYNASVLALQAVSGATHSGSNGSVNIVDENFNGAKSSSYTLTFNTIDVGNSRVSVSGYGVDGNLTKHEASNSVNISVSRPAPSSNANLASIKLSTGSLSPNFSSGTLSYTVTVKNPVDKFTITPGVADSSATASGGGTFDLKVGDNTRSITVTAADGKTKKTYTVTVKRLTVEESDALTAQERANDPLLVVINGEDYHIVSDISALTVPEGFTVSAVNRRDTDIGVLADNGGKYTLYYVTKDSDELKTPILTTRDDKDNFELLPYITVNNKIYIIEEPGSVRLQNGYQKTTYDIMSGSVTAYISTDSRLKDFYWFYCYVDGESGFYRFDSLKTTIQRDPAFEIPEVEAASQEKDTGISVFEAFSRLKTPAKIIVIISVILALSIIGAVVLLVIKIRGKKEKDEEKFFSTSVFDEVVMDGETSDTEENKEE